MPGIEILVLGHRSHLVAEMQCTGAHKSPSHQICISFSALTALKAHLAVFELHFRLSQVAKGAKNSEAKFRSIYIILRLLFLT